MRLKERIPIFLELVDWNNLFKNIWKEFSKEFDIYTGTVLERINFIPHYWKLHPDLRISQILVNLGIIPNTPGFWYYMEEWEILEEQGVNPRDYYLWTSVFFKNGNRRKNPKVKVLKDMDTGHIEKLLNGNWIIPMRCRKAFKDELGLRKDLQ